MKETIYNYDYLKDEDITETVIRMKALIINNKNVILNIYLLLLVVFSKL